VFLRYDTRSPSLFTSASAWEAFDATQLSAQVGGFAGGTFDGRYVYFAPWPDTYALRFDTHGTFASKGSWEGLDLTLPASAALGMQGAVYDGRFVYFVPFADASGNNESDVILRYDNTKTFGDYTHWDTAHLQPLLGNDATGFVGGGFDGRYLYLAPFCSNVGFVARFDTKAGASLRDRRAWSSFETQPGTDGGTGFAGTGFDGRFMYFVPNQDGVVARFDSFGAFEDRGAWSHYDMVTGVSVNASGFWGAVFDGQYMYFVPYETGVVTRFHARATPALPSLPEFHGSFY